MVGSSTTMIGSLSSRRSPQKVPIKTILGLLVLGTCCFYAGLLAGIATAPAPEKIQQPVCPEPQTVVKEVMVERQEQEVAPKSSSNGTPFPETVKRLVYDYSTVPRDDFNAQFDIGVPYDTTVAGSEDVVVLYTSELVTPKSYQNKDSSHSRQSLSPEEATSECDIVKVILTEPSKPGSQSKRECVALVPQWESYHVHKYMRLPPRGALSRTAPLRYVSRSHIPKGLYGKVPMYDRHTMVYYPILVEYLKNLDRLLEELRPIAKEVANGDKTAPIVVLVCNWGQAGLFHNFICSAKARGLDLSRLLIFATDLKTKEMTESMGIHTYYDEAIFGDMPEQAANSYGDRTFTRMMMAKVYCVHLINSLGYHLIFQDVDVVWYKNPIEYFTDQSNVAEWDLMFQDDGAHSIRYAPYSPNTGFYYVKNNERTQFLFSDLLRAGDVVASTSSHQAALTSKLNEHASWKGLRVKVWNRGETNPFPGGFEYHRKKDIMKSIFAKTPVVDPYIFHMSWTQNKDNKKLYFEQMGEWYTKQDCMTGFDCCLPEPEVICHYKDKPSIKPCRDSPPIDKGRPSFW